MTLLDLQGLSVTIPSQAGPVRAVRSIDLRIAKGEIHGLIGESGCGKTMTGMALLGLTPAGAQVAARVFQFDGIDLSTSAAALRGRRIALISQDPAAALNPVLTIGRRWTMCYAPIAPTQRWIAGLARWPCWPQRGCPMLTN